MHPSHVYELYDLYFRFISGTVYFKVCGFIQNNDGPRFPNTNSVSADDCDQIRNLRLIIILIMQIPSQH